MSKFDNFIEKNLNRLNKTVVGVTGQEVEKSKVLDITPSKIKYMVVNTHSMKIVQCDNILETSKRITIPLRPVINALHDFVEVK